ncbi:hypothetical protein GALL_402120 [mine drainage metagenome]|uniref:Uncharacterized protein n=1 Tax=mine drainage metagenome TaxID=410659 RepID=A0A1J5QDM7_9ZZZZ
MECGQERRAGAVLALVRHRQAELGESVEHAVLGVGRRVPAVDFTPAVGEEAQRALRGQPRVELPDAAGGAVARVQQRRAAELALARVVVLEVGAQHDHLAAHLEQPRRRTEQAQRHVADGAHVRGHVLAGLAVAARGAAHQHAVLVAQADGQAVELQLGLVAHFGVAVLQPQARAHALVELGGALRRLAGFSVQRQHRHAVRHRRESGQRRRADALRRRVGSEQLGMLGLEALQLAIQRVIVGVGDQRCVELVVGARIARDLVAQLADARCGAVVAHRQADFS